MYRGAERLRLRDVYICIHRYREALMDIGLSDLTYSKLHVPARSENHTSGEVSPVPPLSPLPSLEPAALWAEVGLQEEVRDKCKGHGKDKCKTRHATRVREKGKRQG
jgi:hypothetical protein